MDRTRAAAIAGAFALGEPRGEPAFVARGAMGELWRVETSDGRRWAVKALFDWAPEDPFPPDVAFQRAAAGLGIHLPAPRVAPDGRAVVDRTRVYEWVDLAPPLPRPVDAATVAEVGGVLGRLHALALAPAPGDEVDEWYVTAPSRSDLAALAERAAGAGRPWAAALARHLPELGDLSDLVAGAPPLEGDVIVCHRDLTPDNAFRPAGGGPLLVLDWENAGPMSAEAELAMTVADWAPEDPAPLLRAYAEAGGTATIRGASSFVTSVATTLNYLGVLVDQSVEDDGHRAFADRLLEARLAVGFGAAVPRGWAS